jgi:hypothetical protein
MAFSCHEIVANSDSHFKDDTMDDLLDVVTGYADAGFDDMDDFEDDVGMFDDEFYV